MEAALTNVSVCNLCVNVPWMQTENLQKHNKESGMTQKERPKLKHGAFSGPVLVPPVQMDAWI